MPSIGRLAARLRYVGFVAGFVGSVRCRVLLLSLLFASTLLVLVLGVLGSSPEPIDSPDRPHFDPCF